jgi:signal transduction histidine kinase
MTTTPPAVAEPAQYEAPPHRGQQMLAQLGLDTTYLLATFPISIVSFVVLVTGLSLAAGLLITVIGIPVGAATLAAAVGFERLERVRLAARGTALAPVHYAPVRGFGLRAMLDQLADPRRWAAALHGMGALGLSCLTFSVIVTWWAGVLGGLTYWFWERWLPDPEANTTLAELLDLPISEAQLNLIIGLAFAATLMPVARWCANLHAWWAGLLLTGSSRRALAAQVEDLTARSTAAAAAEAQSLRRLERDIHDGPQQRLVRLGMDLSAAERHLADDPEAARALLTAAQQQTAETLAELRVLSRGIAPPVLADRGLAAALTSVAARSTVPTAVEVDLPEQRPSAAAENAAYFVVCEALANTAKHAGATSALVRAFAAGDPAVLCVEVHDDGIGGAETGKGHGLAGLADRVDGLGGLLTVSSPAGGPTSVVATIPWT